MANLQRRPLRFSAYKVRPGCACLPGNDTDSACMAASSFDLQPNQARDHININALFARCLRICAAAQFVLGVLVTMALIFEFVRVRYVVLSLLAYRYLTWASYLAIVAALIAIYCGLAMFCVLNGKCAIHVLIVYAGFAAVLAASLWIFASSDDDANYCCQIAVETERTYVAFADLCELNRTTTTASRRSVDEISRLFCAFRHGNWLADNGKQWRRFFVETNVLLPAPESCNSDDVDRKGCNPQTLSMADEHRRWGRMLGHLMIPQAALGVCMLLMCFLTHVESAVNSIQTEIVPEKITTMTSSSQVMILKAVKIHQQRSTETPIGVEKVLADEEFHVPRHAGVQTDRL